MRFCENNDCNSRSNDTGSLFRVVASSTCTCSDSKVVVLASSRSKVLPSMVEPITLMTQRAIQLFGRSEKMSS